MAGGETYTGGIRDPWKEIEIAPEGGTPAATDAEAAFAAGAETPPADDPDFGGNEADLEENDPDFGENAPEAGESAPGPDKPDPAAADFTLTVLGEKRAVSYGELIALAQRGADYDRVKAKNAEYESFLGELAAWRKVPPAEVMDRTRAAILAEAQGLDPATALERVRLDRERRQWEAQKARSGASGAAEAPGEGSNPSGADIPGADEAPGPGRVTEAYARRRDGEIREFLAEFGQVDPRTIPAEVWQAVQGGTPLLTAYLRHENRRLRDRLLAAEQERSNRRRTAGSQATAGAAETLSEWERLWYSD